MISAVRFFTVAPLHSRYMLMALAAVLVSGAASLALDPARGAEALGPLVLLQMLAASTGFAVGARRGHLDLLLTAGPSRMNIAIVHLAASILPGILVWLALGVVEALAAGTMRPQAFSAGSIVAIGVVSVLAWALTVRLPRLSGGIAWLLGIAVWVVGWSGGQAVLAATNGAREGNLATALIVTLCPFVLIGKRLRADQVPMVLPVIALAASLAVVAVRWIVRMDVSLESAQ